MLYEKYGIYIVIKHHPGVNQVKQRNIIFKLFHILATIATSEGFRLFIFHRLPSFLYKKYDSIIE